MLVVATRDAAAAGIESAVPVEASVAAATDAVRRHVDADNRLGKMAAGFRPPTAKSAGRQRDVGAALRKDHRSGRHSGSGILTPSAGR